jgi:hypothetical protein
MITPIVVGDRFGRLTVVGPGTPRGSHRRWLCACDCGSKPKEIEQSNLRTGASASCGCQCFGRPTHGLRYSRTYQSWCAMKSRCSNPNNKNFKHYGGRGISVYEQWRVSFTSFLADMGECPPNLTLERKDNDGNYEPNNCIWATRSAQAINQRHANRSKWGCGVYKQGSHWRAAIRRNGTNHYLGWFSNPEAARETVAAAELLHGKFSVTERPKLVSAEAAGSAAIADVS